MLISNEMARAIARSAFKNASQLLKTLVDTCVLSEVHRRGGSLRVREQFIAPDADDIYLSVLTVGELKKGIERLRSCKRRDELRRWHEQIIGAAGDRLLAVNRETALIWGELAAAAERKGRPIPAIDGLIAATALQHGLHLMTRNTADLTATGVTLTNPWED